MRQQRETRDATTEQVRKRERKKRKGRLDLTSDQKETVAEAQKLARIAGETIDGEPGGEPTEEAIAAAKTLAGMKDKLKNSGLLNRSLKGALNQLAGGDLSGLANITAELGNMEQYGVKVSSITGSSRAQMSRLVVDREAEVVKLHKDAGQAQADYEEANTAAKADLEEINRQKQIVNRLTQKQRAGGTLTSDEQNAMSEAQSSISKLENSAAVKKRQEKLADYMAKKQKSDANDRFIEQTHKMMTAPSAVKIATGAITTFADSFFSDPTIQKAWSPIKSGWHGMFEGTAIDITAEGVKAAEERFKKQYKENYQVVIDAHERAELAKKVEADGKTIAYRISMQANQDATFTRNVTVLEQERDAAIAKMRSEIRAAKGTEKMVEINGNPVKITADNIDQYLEQVSTSQEIMQYTTALQVQKEINTAIQANDTETLRATLGNSAMMQKLQEVYKVLGSKVSTSGLDPKIADLITAIKKGSVTGDMAADITKAYDDIKDLAEKAKKLKESRKKQQSSGAPKAGEL